MTEENKTSTSGEGKEELSGALEPKVAPSEPVKGAEELEPKETPEPTTPPPRTYSEEEFRTRQSSWDKQMAETDKKHKEELKQVREQLVAQQRKDFLAQVEAAGEDVDKAGKLFDREQTVIAKEQEQEALAQLLDGAKKDRDADGFVSKFGLEATAKEELLKAENPAEMRSRALEMALEKSKAEVTPPTKTPSGVGSGKGVDTSKMSPHDRLGEYFKEKQSGE